ncbi:Protein kinase-like domain superfamily [Arabidopsis suecica]|uniref:Receptor-like serine/threonine-protein kinase n=2 Tax=Arabidopsis TaxID=3701 RepID=A0A8T2E4V7_ARASU|nr:Protein kinase-like domain superfamily [Arabidopsis suecica]
MPCTTYLPLLLLLLFLLPPPSVQSKVIIKGNQTILSFKAIFRLGFFSTTNGSSNWYLGISYASMPTPTHVWVANRIRPVSDPDSSTLELTSTGYLIVSNLRDGVVWQTDNKQPGTDFRFSETGNLILINDDGSPVWQSFDNPTDTWLPGMNVTGVTAMTSWRSLFDPSPGFYSLRLSPSFNEFQLVYKGTTPYWSTGNWTGEAFVGVPEMTIPYIYRFHFVNPYTPTASFWYIVPPLDSVSEPRLTRFMVGANGQLKQYTWDPQTQSWNMFWLQPENPCRVYNLCGQLGFCSSELLKPCACIRGFRPRNDAAWRSDDYSDGCRRENGDSGEKSDTFEAVGDLRYDGDVKMSRLQVSKSSCAKTCLGNSSCVGFYHKEKSNLCKILLESPNNLKNSSSWTGTSEDVLYIREPKKGDSKGNISKSIIILCSVVGSISVLGFTLLVPLILLKRSRKRKKTRKQDEDGFAVLNLKVFSFKELQSATNGFSDKVGHGGFGAVFKGTLPGSSTFVAVKRLERPGSGESEFRAEVCTIGNIQHVNLVRLRGFCSENLHRLLVYDYMPQGSLSSYLSRTSPKLLSWETRFRIALGTAKGIAYLHEGCRDCIIHCDIKPENILLDSDYNAKVSDFGLAKLLGRDFSRVLATMRGTWGYVAPEWISGLPITTKADVYSFGMTLLELIGGRRNVIVNSDTLGEKETEPEKWFFPPWAAREIIQGNVDSVVDSRLNGEYNTEEVTRMATVAIWCIQDNEEIRPAMGTVVKMLEGVVEVTVPPPPKLIQALVSGDSYRGVSGTSCSEGHGCSDLNTGLSSPGSRSSFGRPSP